MEKPFLIPARYSFPIPCAARMVQYHDRDRLDDAGNFYNALGWSFARGKGKDIHTYEEEEKIFSSCGGAAIYRRKVFERIGYFDTCQIFLSHSLCSKEQKLDQK